MLTERPDPDRVAELLPKIRDFFDSPGNERAYDFRFAMAALLEKKIAESLEEAYRICIGKDLT